MTPEAPDIRAVPRDATAAGLQAAARLGAGFVIVLSGIVLAGWAFGIPALTSIVPGFARMSVPTALAFILSGISLVLLTQARADKRRLAIRRLCAAIVLLIGMCALASYVVTAQLSLTQHGSNSGYIFGPSLGSVAPATALSFVLLAAALLLGKTPMAGRIFAILLAGGLIVSGLDLVGYAYRVEALYKVMPFSAMSLPTAIAFVILILSAFLARPFDGWTQRIAANDSGGFAARRLLPAVVIIPLVLALLMERANEEAIFAAPFGFAVLAVATIVLLVIIVVRNSAWLAHRDVELREEVTLRRQAQGKLQMQLARLNLHNQITRAIGDRLDLRSIFQIVVRSLEDQLPVDFACFCLYDSGRNALTVDNVGVKSRPLAKALAMSEEAIVPIDQDGLSQCIEGRLVYEEDIRASAFAFPRRLAGAGLRALVISPLIVERAVFGTLIIARHEAGSFTSSDCEFMKQLSEHVALAVHQVQLHNSLKRAYDDLRQTQLAVMQQERLRALGQMASGIAHDINNAISPVSLYTESLLENEPNLSARTRSYLELMKRVINDIAATVARLREFYRPGETGMALVPVDLNELAGQVIDLTRARWSDMPQQRGIVIGMHTELQPDLPHVMGIGGEIREALTNLIFNAVDAMPGGGELTVRSKRSESRKPDEARRIQLEIADTGTGMDDETRRRCLEPFFTTKGERGTGLGLAMVYGTLQRHGANIEIDSAPGKGTLIRLIFCEAAADKAAQSPPAAGGQLPPLRILLVDDDPFILDSMRMVLELDGHSVTLADGGQAGIDAFEIARAGGTPFDVVFTDLGMPHVDGRQVAHTIRSSSPATQIVLLTGWGQRLGDRELVLDVDHMLGKPAQLSDLRETLAACSSRLKI